MAVVKFSARNIATLPVLAQRVDYVDASLRGFLLRVSPTGNRSFGVTYYLGGRVRRYTIGDTLPSLWRMPARLPGRSSVMWPTA
jgi:hypothetical protein